MPDTKPQSETYNPALPGYVNTGLTSDAVEMTVKFVDGDHVVPGWIVAQLGGARVVDQARASLAKFSYQKFYQAHLDQVYRSNIKQAFQGFKEAHFAKLRSGNRFQAGGW